MEFTDIKGFKDKRIQMLKEAGINTPADLLLYFPSCYLYLNRLTDLSKAEEGERVVILARTFDKPKAAYLKKRLSVVKVKFDYVGKNVWCSWFNQPFMAKNIMPETYYYIYGKLKKYKSSYEITAPKIIKFTGSEPAVLPVYKPIGKIGSQLLADAVKTALSAVSVESFITPRIAEKYGLSDLNSAFKNIHFPQTAEDVQSAKRVISTEKLAYMLAAYSLIRSSHDLRRVYNYGKDINKVTDAINGLPYDLTSAQKDCLNKIFNGLSSNERLNVLLEGDVGCGKTIVAFLCMYYAALNGYQSVLMAPTEILARQHAKTLSAMLSPFGINVGLLVAGMKAAEKHAVRAGLADGSINVAVGTQALISEATVMNNCALVIADEQHRFGVRQRAALLEKSVCDGRRAHILVMSATPIPRSLSLIIFGDLDLSLLDERPPGRREVATRVITESELPSVYEFVRREAAAGGRAYFVCPAIEEGEDDSGKISAEGLYKELSESIFPDIPIGLLHGRMRNCDKEHVMNAFACGDIKILVSTTVVEVGVDVPEATVMVIMNAESFGLSQLHQLRGRVGRGSRGSVCCLVNGGGGDEAADRLKVLAETNDGFRVAEADLKKRGPGDFFGERQSGEFSLAFMGAGDVATIKETDGIVTTIIENKETGEYSAVFGAAQRFLENSGSTLTVN